MSSAEASIVVAIVSLVGVVFSLFWSALQQKRLTLLQSRLSQEHEARSKEELAANLVSRFRDPLLESAFDLQSRLYNSLRKRKSGVFRWGRDDDYYLPSTLFLFGQFLGWVEILRRDMLYSDIANVGETKGLLTRIRKIQGLLSTTSGEYIDRRRIYRVEQRAIGELMIQAADLKGKNMEGRETIGYVEFKERLDSDASFSKWFSRLSSGLDNPPAPDEPDRLRQVQIELVELLAFLDPQSERFPSNRQPLPGNKQSDLQRM